MSAPKASLGPQACSTACSRHLPQAPLVGSPTLVLLPTPRRLGSGRRSAPLLLACHFARRRLPEGSSPDLRSKYSADLLREPPSRVRSRQWLSSRQSS